MLMMNTDFNISDIGQIAEQIYALKDRCHIFALKGDLGAGKTTLVKTILKKWGVKDVVTSPTYTYVSVYKGANGVKLYHFDLYRLTTMEQFIESGFDEFLSVPHSWVFIEWPELVMPLLKNLCLIELHYQNNEERKITVQVLSESKDSVV